MQATTGLAALVCATLVLVLPTLGQRLRAPGALRLAFPATLLAAAYALVHAALVLRTGYDSDPSLLAQSAAAEPALLAGVGALVLLLPPALTAHGAAVRLIGRERWRDLQRSLWPAVGLAIAHALTLGETTIGLGLTIACAVTLLGFAIHRLRALRRELGHPPPQDRSGASCRRSVQAVRFFDQRPK